MRAVLFASATAATLGCERSANRTAHLLSRSSLGFAVRNAERAPWTISVRRYASPRLLIPSSRSLPPELCCLGVNPSEAANCRPLASWRGSPRATTSAGAIIGPMPRSCCIRRAAGSLFAIAAMSLSSSQARLSRTRRSPQKPSSNRRKRSVKPLSASSSQHGIARRSISNSFGAMRPYSATSPRI